VQPVYGLGGKELKSKIVKLEVENEQLNKSLDIMNNLHIEDRQKNQKLREAIEEISKHVDYCNRNDCVFNIEIVEEILQKALEE
jgi:hypothetical protein